MALLNNEHIDYIIRDLRYRGVVLDGFDDEITDHICSAVEEEMSRGRRFIDAYHLVLNRFGHTGGLRHTQGKLVMENKTTVFMVKNYFRIAVRNLLKQRFYALINMTGLAVGLAAFLIIVLYVNRELSYDRYTPTATRTFRVNNELRFGDNEFHLATSGAPLAAALLQEYAEIESAVRLVSYGTYLVNAGDGRESIKEKHVLWADSTFFRVFDLNILQGNARTALAEPYTIAISERIAKKYFPGKDPLGQFLMLDNVYEARVSLVYENMPATSHFHADILISMYGDWPVARESRSTVYSNKNFYTYLLLKDGGDAGQLEAKLPQFVRKHIQPHDHADGNFFAMTLMPVTDIHLHGTMDNELEPNGSIRYVYFFATIALLILAVACVNFMNMSTARSGSRAKEVGVRKVMGSLRSHLVRQFLFESSMVVACSTVVALAIAFLFLPVFNSFSAIELEIPFGEPGFYLAAVLVVIIVGVLAGVYPAFILSAFKPVNVLKGSVVPGMKSSFVRSSLVVFQLMVSILLIIGTITVNRQLSYVQNKKLGFEKDQVLVILDAYALRPNVGAFKNHVAALAGVAHCSISGFVPVESQASARNDRTFWNAAREPVAENLVSLQNWNVDHDYVNTLGMEIISGRDFSRAHGSDQSAIILNETAVERFRLGDDPIGKSIHTFSTRGGQPDFSKPIERTVIGVVRDFHFSSFKESIAPLGLSLGKSDGMIMVKFKASSAQEIIHSLEKTWKGMAPGQPFQYSFLEEDFGMMYASETRLAAIFSLFSGLAIFLACLGLFALTALTSEQRTREIGIRKVLGASVGSIVLLLTRDLGKLVLISFLLVLPIAWIGVTRWLETYSYRTEIGAIVYITAGLFTLSLALMTTGSLSARAANRNPVDCLRGE